MRKPYKTKKRRVEFKAAYAEIGELNQTINNLEIEIRTFIDNAAFDEAIMRQQRVNEMKIRLLELGKCGWDIEYTTPMVTGLEVKVTTHELK